MLADKIRHYQEEKKMLKNTPAGYKKEYPWLKEVDSLALANVQLNLEGAFRKFFREPGVGFPHYKSKKHSRKSYTTNMVNGNICLQDRFLKLPKMQPVKIKLHRMIPEGWKLKSVTVSREPSGKYFASLLFDCENQTAEKRQAEKFLGMDFAMHGMCVFSTGERAGYPMFYRNAEKKLARYEKDYDIPRYDAELITGTKKMADLFEATCAICNKPKKVSNWLMVETMRLLKEHSMEPEDISFSPANLAKLIGLTEDGTINSSVAKEVFEQVFEKNVDPESYVEEHGLKTVNDEGALEEVLKEVIAKNPKAIADYKGGKEKALGALVGQTMKAMKGKANPGMVNEKLREMLN